MSTTRPSTDPLRIDEAADAERTVVIHPENEDRFVRTGKQVIEACRLDISIEIWRHEFRSVIEHVRAWAAKHARQVQTCYISPRTAKLMLFVVPQGNQFDFDLADEMVMLNRDLMRNFAVGTVELLQIPATEKDRFMHPAEALPIYVSP